jgi:hypothetical protein
MTIRDRMVPRVRSESIKRAAAAARIGSRSSVEMRLIGLIHARGYIKYVQHKLGDCFTHPAIDI